MPILESLVLDRIFLGGDFNSHDALWSNWSQKVKGFKLKILIEKYELKLLYNKIKNMYIRNENKITTLVVQLYGRNIHLRRANLGIIDAIGSSDHWPISYIWSLSKHPEYKGLIKSINAIEMTQKDKYRWRLKYLTSFLRKNLSLETTNFIINL